MTKARVLVAEGDRLALTALGKGLREKGYTVYEATDGEEAARLCSQYRPDLAILEVRLTGMDGIEAARRLREETATPFMMISESDDCRTVVEAARVGALCYLLKPVDAERLAPSIEAALHRAAELQKLRDAENHLNTALESNRLTSTAIGLIMERYCLTREAAFEMLRSQARSQRRKLAEIAGDLVQAAETINGVRS
ncbi:response regulator [Thiohalobacter sp. IOR34]|uniref:ANTAR domain-containing response regulator n=1 Tax=Thiohalobacter sp. IOR34 TaxID=3057176 RepID=UPI0025AFDFE5|nr:response regulator [Thiohalobacter sp. IOR34]WJW75425.1 response regulator [Thiohalobacter sp. IOR34]